jgi:S1-C subfamily serine protease
LPTLTLGDTGLVRQGDHILTLGSPLGLEETASEGIVSAVRKSDLYGVLIQISAPISPGNSGGPVLNLVGEVVGIVDFRLREGQALNFALAVNTVSAAMARTGGHHTTLGTCAGCEAHKPVRTLLRAATVGVG